VSRHPDLGPEQEWPFHENTIKQDGDNPVQQPPTRLAVAIKLLLASRDIDQKQFASYVGTSPSTITRFLRGKCMPDAATVMRIVSWLMEVE